jgi:hypothetical protein
MVLAIKTFMKAIKFITHPYTLITSFLVILISGQHLGGFYAFYLLLGLPYGALHSIIALLGIMVLVLIHNKYKGVKVFTIKYVANLVGLILLVLSLVIFFYKDKSDYNVGTFYQTVPQIMLAVFILIAISFAVDNIASVIKIFAQSNLRDRKHLIH